MISLDKLLPHVGGSVFCLARVAMLRALEINSGKPILVDSHPLDKATTIALKEISQGKVTGSSKLIKSLIEDKK